MQFPNIIPVPRHWSESSCRVVLMKAAGVARHGAEDLRVEHGLVHGAARPYTVQTGQPHYCHVETQHNYSRRMWTSRRGHPSSRAVPFSE